MSNDNWGQAARFGVFIVGAEVVPEAEWWAMLPPGTSVHAARVSAPAPWATWDSSRQTVTLADDVERGARQFAAMRLSVAVMGHSSSSILGGAGWDDAVVARLSEHLGPSTAVTTNGDDCARALRHCGVRRPFVVFPAWFNDATIRAGQEYFERAGFDIAATFRHVPEARWSGVPPQDLYGQFMHLEQSLDLLRDQILAECPPDADGVLIAGTGVRCVGIIDALEAGLKRPVVTANQASLWRSLALAGVEAPVSGYGQLVSG